MTLKRELGALLKRGLDRHLRLGVTGLSRAGKTAFITSFVNQLHHAGGHLEFFAAARDGRILGARRIPQRNLDIPAFPYESALDSLHGDAPSWPQPTRGISELRLAIRFQSRRGPLRLTGETATLYVDIVDYPGEWLLDLPMLEQSYLEWSAQASRWYGAQRRAMAADWLAAVNGLDWRKPLADTAIAELAAHYTDSLVAAKAAGLAYIQPGRFVMPGDLAGAPVLQFFPALDLAPEAATALAGAPRNSLFRTLQARYDYYRRHIVEPFYRRHFARLDRQIVLVDCLTALNRGDEAMDDMRLSIAEILGNFRYGQRDLLRRLIRPRIDRLVFAATKSDHITGDQHSHLLALLRDLVRASEERPRFEAVSVHSLCLAAVRASEEVVVETPEGRCPALRGRLPDGAPITFYPGDVPASLPAAALWQSHRFDFQQLHPRQQPAGAPLPHLRMDSALELLLGDKLR